MADEADFAQKEQDFLESRRRERAAAAAGGGEPPTHCRDCGEPIPEARREAVPGATRCVSCAELLAAREQHTR